MERLVYGNGLGTATGVAGSTAGGGDITALLMEPAFNGIIIEIQAEGTGHKPTEKGDGVLGQFLEQGGEFFKGHDRCLTVKHKH